MKDIQVLGCYVEDGRNGPKVVLVQSRVQSDGTTEEIEHEASNEKQLWKALIAILEEPGQSAEQEPAFEPSIPNAAGGTLMDAGLSEATRLIERTAGPLAGRVAEAMIRNPAQTRMLGGKIADAFRSVSRGTREPRIRRNR